MTKLQLKIAAAISAIYAGVTVPTYILAFYLYEVDSPGVVIPLSIMMIVDVLMFVFVVVSLRSFLAKRCDYRRLDNLLVLLATIYVIQAPIDAIGPAVSEPLGTVLAVFQGLTLIPFGIVLVLAYSRLGELSDSLYGLLTPLRYALLVTGVGAISMFLLPIFIGGLMVVMAMLSAVFILAAQESEAQSS